MAVLTTITVEDLKRKRQATQGEDDQAVGSNLADLVNNLLDEIKELSKTVTSNKQQTREET